MVGVLKEKIFPEGWESKTLTAVANSKRFAIVDGPFGTQLHADEYVEEGIPLVRVTNLSYEGRFSLADIKFLTDKKAKQISRSEILPGDLIIAKTGATIGKCALFPELYSRGIIASSCLKISFDKEKAHPNFFLYLLVSPGGQKAIINGAGGSTRTTINIGPFEQISFTIPNNVREQKTIANVLATIDEAIDKTDAMIDKYTRVKHGLKQDLFRYGIDENGQIRSEKTHKFKDSPLGRIPEGWEAVVIKDCCDILDNKRVPLNEETRSKIPGDIPYYGANGIQGYINSYIFDEELILIAEDGGNFEQFIERPIAYKITGKSWVNNHAHVLKAKDEFIQDYIFYSLEHKNILYYIKGGTRSKLNRSELDEIVIAMPLNKSEQARIAFNILQADEAIKREEIYKQKLLAMKWGLMDDLLSGKVRVSELMKN